MIETCTSVEFKKNYPNILLVGYNGANNTGSEARLLAIIEDIYSVLGPQTNITVPTLNEENLRRYLKEGPTLHIIPIPSIFFFALNELVKKHDMVMLIEGSCYMDTWTSFLLWAYLWATNCAFRYKKPCLAYAVDAGKLSGFNRNLVQREASKTDLIITRTLAAAARLKSWGVTAQIEVSADSALTFGLNHKKKKLPQKLPENISSGMVGFAVVDFFLWPVSARLWGPKQYCYRWPYYFSYSNERSQATETLIRCIASFVDRVIKEYDKNIALICMEDLDEPLAIRIHNKMKYSERAQIFSSNKYDAYQMTHILRGLDFLVTSRYHASVLSLSTQVPQIAVGHDLRLEDLYKEIGLEDDFFIKHSSKRMCEMLNSKFDNLITKQNEIKDKLLIGFKRQQKRENRNRELLRTFVESHGL